MVKTSVLNDKLQFKVLDSQGEITEYRSPDAYRFHFGSGRFVLKNAPAKHKRNRRR